MPTSAMVLPCLPWNLKAFRLSRSTRPRITIGTIILYYYYQNGMPTSAMVSQCLPWNSKP